MAKESASRRDNFPARVIKALALRAAYRCSICDVGTTGPSDESPTAVAIVGEASHICAASPGGRRYDRAMSAEQRSDVSNGIWLCATHARLVGRDDRTFTVEALRSAKAAHEAKIKAELAGLRGESGGGLGLIGIGPKTVCMGALTRVESTQWCIRISHFVRGELNDLIRLVDGFDGLARVDRCLLVAELGDGRELSSPPSLRREGDSIELCCAVEPPFPRRRGQELGADLAVNDKNDIFLRGGDFAIVRGLDALPQKVTLTLSAGRGEYLFHPEAGSHFGDYYHLYEGSPWLAELLKLEIIRLASIPLSDGVTGPHTPLQCVERVHSVEVLDAPAGNRLPIHIALEVKGAGRWEQDLRIRVPVERQDGS